jgi:cytochrome oxidase Cu insertion factor (SCO1/SenC/PrrC family)
MAKNKKVKSTKKPIRAEVKAKPKSAASASKNKIDSLVQVNAEAKSHKAYFAKSGISKTKAAPVNSASSLPTSRKIFFIVVTLIIGIVLIWKSYIQPKYFSHYGALQKGQAVQIQNAGVPQIGGPFVLVDQDGKTVSETDFMGKYMLVYFGFTYCPDVCPTSLTIMEDALDMLGDKAERITPIFITVDPERDDPEAMKLYVEHFHPRLVGLTGSLDQVNAVAKTYKAYFTKSGDGYDDDDYSVDHSSITYLMAPDGKFVTHFSHGVEVEFMAQKLAEILK